MPPDVSEGTTSLDDFEGTLEEDVCLEGIPLASSACFLSYYNDKLVYISFQIQIHK